VDNDDPDIVRQLIWGGMLAAIGALSGMIAHRISSAIWVRVFDEEPPG
jgi:hypothetical protein